MTPMEFIVLATVGGGVGTVLVLIIRATYMDLTGPKSIEACMVSQHQSVQQYQPRCPEHLDLLIRYARRWYVIWKCPDPACQTTMTTQILESSLVPTPGLVKKP